MDQMDTEARVPSFPRLPRQRSRLLHGALSDVPMLNVLRNTLLSNDGNVAEGLRGKRRRVTMTMTRWNVLRRAPITEGIGRWQHPQPRRRPRRRHRHQPPR